MITLWTRSWNHRPGIPALAQRGVKEMTTLSTSPTPEVIFQFRMHIFFAVRCLFIYKAESLQSWMVDMREYLHGSGRS